MTEIHSATPQLLALAEAMRPDWGEREMSDLAGALASAHGSGWPFARACLAAVRVMCDAEAEPRELMDQTRNPLRPAPKSEPVDLDAIPELAQAKARLAEVSAQRAAQAAAGDRG